jgi:hypothetical protein|tara:strand:- start:17577 stop:17951 length:375 start_codon:yes stop_codon:yes gene_type:complete
MTEPDSAERLMSALISKMERMDSDLSDIREQNQQLRKMMLKPASLLKRAGFVRADTPAVQDVWGDPLRGDSTIMKEEDGGDAFDMPKSNEDFFDMDWSEIHNLANQAKSLGHVANTPMPEVNVE